MNFHWASSRVPTTPQRQCRSHLALKVQCSKLYSFADAAEQKPGGRRNRRRLKGEEQDLRNLVVGMCQMTEKQLKAVIGICGEPIVEAVKLAIRLPRTNQGRKRQESLVVKLLREQMDDPALSKLSEAVELSQTSNNSYVDKDVQAQVDEWREALLSDDQAVLEEVLSQLVVASRGISTPASAAPDTSLQGVAADGNDDEPGLLEVVSDVAVGGSEGPEPTTSTAVTGKKGGLVSDQEFRTLVRQCQAVSQELRQLQEQQKAYTTGAPVVNGGGGVISPFSGVQVGLGGLGGADEDGELAQALLEASARARRRSQSSSSTQSEHGKGSKPAPGSASGGGGMQLVAKRHKMLMRSLNGVLKALASRSA